MAFENISKGEFRSNYKSVVEKYGNEKVVCYGPDGQKNAEFISYCFNLQQRYDISKLEEVVKELDEIKLMCDGNITNENNIWHKCNNVLKEIKR